MMKVKLKPKCTVDGCKKIHLAKGLCRKHYYQRRSPNGIPAKACSIRNCAEKLFAKELCSTHYERFKGRFAKMVKIRRNTAQYMVFDVFEKKIVALPPVAAKMLLALAK